MPCAGDGANGTKIKIEMIIIKFKITGAAAGAANLLREFKMPDWNDTIEMNNKNGKVIRDSSIASEIFSGLLVNPGAKMVTNQGIRYSTNMTNKPTKKVRTDMAFAANKIACFLSSHTSFCDSIGTNAVVKAPSAKRERNKFGNLKATKKASDIKPAPKKLAKIISRKNPVMRDKSVKPPKVAIDLNKFIFRYLFCCFFQIEVYNIFFRRKQKI